MYALTVEDAILTDDASWLTNEEFVHWLLKGLPNGHARWNLKMLTYGQNYRIREVLRDDSTAS